MEQYFVKFTFFIKSKQIQTNPNKIMTLKNNKTSKNGYFKGLLRYFKEI